MFRRSARNTKTLNREVLIGVTDCAIERKTEVSKETRGNKNCAALEKKRH